MGSHRQRDTFRATGGKCTIWGKKPVCIEAEYVDALSLLLRLPLLAADDHR